MRGLAMFVSNLISATRSCIDTGRASRASRRRLAFVVEQLEVRRVLAPLGSVPMGLVDVISNNHNNPKPVSERVFKQDLQTISDPSISGVAFQIDWKAIETFTPATQNKPAVTHMDWSRLDQLFRAADKAGKWVQLLISPGFWSPPGVLSKRNNVTTDDFHVEYGQHHDHELLPLPMPWDPVYLADWAAFLKQVSQRYENNREFRVIAAAGPTSVSDEFTEPNQVNENVPQQWITDHFTQAKYNAAWQTVFVDYAQDFPKQYVSLSIGSGVPEINADGSIVSGTPAQQAQEILDNAEATRTALFDEASETLANGQFVYQSSALTGTPHQRATTQSSIGELISENGYVITGFQLGSSAELASAKQGAAGDPALAMVLSVDTGMQLNTNGKHVDYIEVYSEDVQAAQDGTDPAMRAVLGWAASLFPQESALNVVMTSLTEGQTNSPTASVNVTFSEPVSDFSAKDLKVDGGYITNFTGSGSSYSFTLSTLESGGTASVRIPANTVTDQNGNENTAAPPFDLTFVLKISKPHPSPHPM